MTQSVDKQRSSDDYVIMLNGYNMSYLYSLYDSITLSITQLGYKKIQRNSEFKVTTIGHSEC